MVLMKAVNDVRRYVSLQLCQAYEALERNWNKSTSRVLNRPRVLLARHPPNSLTFRG
jgi:hypothetical protein